MKAAAVPPLFGPRAPAPPVGWRVLPGLTPYAQAVAAMEARAAAIAAGEAAECVWLLEHPPLYTAGTSAGAVDPQLPFPLYRTGRGGQVTYHGPGQRVLYLMLDLDRRRPDLRAFVGALEAWVIAALARLDVRGEIRPGRVGVWVARPDKAPAADGSAAEDKIAAIGIRIRRWVSFHGVSLNVAPDLAHFRAITPCGISAAHLGVTSLADLGRTRSMAEVDSALAAAFQEIFGEIVMEASSGLETCL